MEADVKSGRRKLADTLPTLVLAACWLGSTLPASDGELVKIFKIDHLTNCVSRAPQPAFILPEYSARYDRGLTYFNCTLRITEEIGGPLKYVANIKRCEMDLTKCEFFNEIEVPELCDYFGSDWFQRSFLNNISTALSCPTQPADYRFLDTMWDMTPIVNLPGSAYRWNITATVTQVATGRVVYCTYMMARIVIIRKKGSRVKQRKH